MPEDSNTHIYSCENKLQINNRLVTNNIMSKTKCLLYSCVYNTKMGLQKLSSTKWQNMVMRK